MKVNVLSLNCQKNYQGNLSQFFEKHLKKNSYDVFLLQEATAEVLSFFDNFKEYKIVHMKDELGRHRLPSIVFNSSLFDKVSIEYTPFLFDSFERKEFDKPFQSFGAMRLRVKHKSKRISFVSLHLPSGFSAKIRRKALSHLKIVLDKEKSSDLLVVSGDFNFGYKKELSKAQKLMAPEFFFLSEHLGPTLDSHYTESNIKYSFAVMNNYLRKVGISFKLPTDHFFTDKKSFETYSFRSRVLDDRVSDHSPIELVVKSKK